MNTVRLPGELAVLLAAGLAWNWRRASARRNTITFGCDGGLDAETPDPNRPRMEDPDGIGIPPDGWRDGEPLHPERARRGVGWDGVGHQRRDTAPGRRIDVERAKVDEALESARFRVRDIDPVGHTGV